ncbi:hypothetical protein [Aminicella lysinilytica]|uniref:Uncharacterized protein n=1 Tax=Aminicella lysinilytica TaxID=433323 RepID=A0A4R6PYY7_9FIRM|nr:hypothetical protein [Aminicella lysinilytica]NLD11515.1 hypothetical protein [Clostridiales bacterium]TDP51854.1 hypothetical protein EV211_12932 [Aminicella lysinilytica]
MSKNNKTKVQSIFVLSLIATVLAIIATVTDGLIPMRAVMYFVIPSAAISMALAFSIMRSD